jgi:Flp pilus assembly protein CpaB
MSLSFDSDRVFYLQPEDKVDIIVVDERDKDKGPQSPQGAAATTLIKRARVLAVKPSESSPGKSVVELELSPNEAMYLEEAAVSGDIWLALRRKGEVEDRPMALTTWSQLLGSDVLVHRLAPAPGGVLLTGGSASIALRTEVESRMTESRPALSLPIATDKVQFLQPGDQIDVLASFDAVKPKGGGKDRLTASVLHNVPVLDVRKSQSQAGQSLLLLGLIYNEIPIAALAWDSAEIQLLTLAKSDQVIDSTEPVAVAHIYVRTTVLKSSK